MYVRNGEKQNLFRDVNGERLLCRSFGVGGGGMGAQIRRSNIFSWVRLEGR